MAKLSVNGELFDYDLSRRMMSEALEFEAETGLRYADWEAELGAGSLVGFAGLVWMIWHRDGREVPFADIASGKVDVNLQELFVSLKKAADEMAELQADPKGSPGAKAGTPTTRGTTRRS